MREKRPTRAARVPLDAITQPDVPPLAARHAAQVTRACRRLESADRAPALAVLAHEAGLSAYYFHRVFKAATGLTPAAYAAAHRAHRVRDALARGGRVTDAIYDAGYGSSGRFYGQSRAVLGMTPSAYRAGGADILIQYAHGACSLGRVLVAASARGVCAILLGDADKALTRDLQRRFPRAQLAPGDAGFARVVASVVRVVETPARGLDLPLDVRGTAFQQRVWQALQRIPAGSTATYTDVARRIGSPKAIRAVASACAANTLAVAIPCHRVVRSDGGLAGYRWGIARKRALLKREAE